MPTVISPQQRGPGLQDTGDLSINTIFGQNAQPGRLYTLTAIMQNADINDTSLVIDQISIIMDGNTVYGPTEWHGGQPGRDGVTRPPTFSYGPGNLLPTTIRLTANLPQRMQFGLNVTSDSLVQ